MNQNKKTTHNEKDDRRDLRMVELSKVWVCLGFVSTALKNGRHAEAERWANRATEALGTIAETGFQCDQRASL